MIKATIEIDNGTHVVLLQDEEGNKMVTSVLPLLDMIKSGKDILVEGDNVVAGKVKDYIINLKENLDILEDIKEMVGKEPETVIPVNFMNKATLEGHVLKLDCNSVSHTPTIDKYFNERVNSSYFYNKMYFNPSSDVIDKMNEANEPMLKLKSNNGMINHFLKCDFMTVNENIDTYYFFYKDKVVATCSMKSYDDMAIAMQGGEEEGPTLDVLFVFFNVKDINGELVPHFMIPSLNSDNAYIMEEGHDDPVSLVKKALGDYKLSKGDMEYLGWEGDTPPNLTRDDINEMVKIDDCWVSVTRKVPRKLIVRE